jgi:hypothetical protein
MKVLLIGNSLQNYKLKNEYDIVVCFNKASKSIRKISTVRWLRTDATCQDFNGNDNCKLPRVYVQPCNGNKDKMKGDIVDVIYNSYASLDNKCPSTGYIAFKYYQEKGYDVELVGFQFKGIKKHSFSYEAKELKKYCIDTRKAHFVYVGENVFNRNLYYALYSFLIHHRHWEVTLWTDVHFQENAMLNACINEGLIIRDFADYAPRKFAKVAHQVDYIRYCILYHFGGLYADALDTITLKSFDELYDKSNKLVWSWYICKASDRFPKSYRSGFLCINHAQNEAVKELMLHEPDENSHVSYELKGNDVVQKYSIEPIDWRICYPIHGCFIQEFMKLKSFNFENETRQLHYFGGNWNSFKTREADILEYTFTLSVANSRLRSEDVK